MWDEYDPDDVDVAEICLKGHVTNDKTEMWPGNSRKFCPDCGSRTIQACPACSGKIPGQQKIESGGFEAPSYCTECGKPYPWTNDRLIAARAMADEMDELDDNDRLLLKSSIDDIAANTAMAEVGVVRYKRIIKKVGKGAGDVLNKLVVSLASEAIKHSLTGS